MIEFSFSSGAKGKVKRVSAEWDDFAKKVSTHKVGDKDGGNKVSDIAQDKRRPLIAELGSL